MVTSSSNQLKICEPVSKQLGQLRYSSSDTKVAGRGGGRGLGTSERRQSDSRLEAGGRLLGNVLGLASKTLADYSKGTLGRPTPRTSLASAVRKVKGGLALRQESLARLPALKPKALSTSDLTGQQNHFVPTERLDTNFEKEKNILSQNSNVSPNLVIKTVKEDIDNRAGKSVTKRRKMRLAQAKLASRPTNSLVDPTEKSNEMNGNNNLTNTSMSDKHMESKVESQFQTNNNYLANTNYIDLSAMNGRTSSNVHQVPEVKDNSNNVETPSYPVSKRSEEHRPKREHSQNRLSRPNSSNLSLSSTMENIQRDLFFPSNPDKSKREVLEEIKNSVKDYMRPKVMPTLAPEPDREEVTEDARVRRRHQLADHLNMLEIENTSAKSRCDSDYLRRQQELERRRRVRGIYDCFFPATLDRPTTRLGVQVADRLELRTRICEARRRKDLVALVFHKNQRRLQQEEPQRGIDIKGPLKYLFDLKSRLQSLDKTI